MTPGTPGTPGFYGRRLFLAAFEREEDLLGITREARRQGYQIEDIHTPYAVHGLEEAMGLPPSRLTWVCLLCGLAGGLGALWLQQWASAVDWPINVGGKPWNSWPAFVPIIFELTVLCAGLGTVAALLVRCGLRPGRRPAFSECGVTNHRFVLVLVEADATFDLEAAQALAERYRAVWTQERVEGQAADLIAPPVEVVRDSVREARAKEAA